MRFWQCVPLVAAVALLAGCAEPIIEPPVSADPAPVNAAPLADFTVSCTNLVCTFTDRSTDPDAGGSVASRAWDFGDVTTSSEQNPTHTYDSPGGRFGVTLTVKDNEGAEATALRQIEVTSPGTGGPPPPQAGQIAFVRDGRIYLASADGGGLVQLSAGPNDNEPAWSPDGARIAFSRSSGGATSIFIMNADGSHVVQRAPSGGDPTWSPDAEWIVFVCRPAAGEQGLCKVKAADDGTTPITIYRDVGYVSGPAWSPDGERIAFMSDRALYDIWFDIWVVAPDGSQLTAISTHTSPEPNPLEHYQPAWSPDGGRIAFVSCPWALNFCSSSAVSVMSADGSGAAYLATSSGFLSPTWSPDGQVIAFASSGPIEWVSADGSQRGGIIDNGHSPAWRP